MYTVNDEKKYWAHVKGKLCVSVRCDLLGDNSTKKKKQITKHKKGNKSLLNSINIIRHAFSADTHQKNMSISMSKCLIKIKTHIKTKM